MYIVSSLLFSKGLTAAINDTTRILAFESKSAKKIDPNYNSLQTKVSICRQCRLYRAVIQKAL